VFRRSVVRICCGEALRHPSELERLEFVRGKAARMTTHLDSTDRRKKKARRVAVEEFFIRFGKPLFVGVLIVLIFMLGEAMVQHRFFQGGRYHANGSVGQ
jgi:hypothetical protein